MAVKVLKRYKEAWTDFSLELNILSSIKHKHITPLIGICLENGLLISVYDYLPKGSLEKYLHGKIFFYSIDFCYEKLRQICNFVDFCPRQVAVVDLYCRGK